MPLGWVPSCAVQTTTGCVRRRIMERSCSGRGSEVETAAVGVGGLSEYTADELWKGRIGKTIAPWSVVDEEKLRLKIPYSSWATLGTLHKVSKYAYS
jgi:hypothetical protein